jgi:hypothetical protein
MKNKIVSRLKWTTIICLLLGIIFLSMGFYKKNVYESDEYSWSEPKNVYVGGDAYNFIINSGYFAGYSVIGMGFVIVSAITGSQAAIASLIGKDEELMKSSSYDQPTSIS